MNLHLSQIVNELVRFEESLKMATPMTLENLNRMVQAELNRRLEIDPNIVPMLPEEVSLPTRLDAIRAYKTRTDALLRDCIEAYRRAKLG